MVAAAATLNCWSLAAARYHEPPYLLYSIASVESSQNPGAVAVARNGTHSIGLMQINSSWFSKLSQVGITEDQLWDPCVNVQVGAWILAQGIDRYGYTWQAIGSYYAGPYDAQSYARKLPDYREYSTKVLTRWRKTLSERDRQRAPELEQHPTDRAASPVTVLKVNQPRRMD
jgi:soluble lytic murein transglycosylase-like protein